eukprot:3054911-Pyramimonas_sp.AAC.1
MARGVPPLVPDYGALKELVPVSAGFRFPARRARCTRAPCSADGRRLFYDSWNASAYYAWGEPKETDIRIIHNKNVIAILQCGITSM